MGEFVAVMKCEDNECVTGFRREPQEVCQLIEDVSKQDIVRVADHLLGSKISVAALGQIAGVPSQRDITHAFINKANFPQGSKFNLFS